MNYIREINAFYDWLETNRLSLSAVALWHALMHINNKTAWTDEFAVAVSVLCVKTGLSPRGVTEARNELKQKGRIEWQSRRGNQSAAYRIISLLNDLPADIADNSAGNHADKCADNSAGNHAALNKQNKINNKNNNIPPIIPPDISEQERMVLNALNGINGYPFDYLKDLAFMRQLAVEFPEADLLEKAKGYGIWVLDNPYTEKSNPRSQFRNWCKPKSWENKRLKAVSGGKGKQREEEPELDWGWQKN